MLDRLYVNTLRNELKLYFSNLYYKLKFKSLFIVLGVDDLADRINNRLF